MLTITSSGALLTVEAAEVNNPNRGRANSRNGTPEINEEGAIAATEEFAALNRVREERFYAELLREQASAGTLVQAAHAKEPVHSVTVRGKLLRGASPGQSAALQNNDPVSEIECALDALFDQ